MPAKVTSCNDYIIAHLAISYVLCGCKKAILLNGIFCKAANMTLPFAPVLTKRRKRIFH